MNGLRRIVVEAELTKNVEVGKGSPGSRTQVEASPSPSREAKDSRAQ